MFYTFEQTMLVLKHLSGIILLIICCINSSAQKGFGFSYSHETIIQEDGVDHVYTIDHVFRHSPAEKAGVMKGDKIVRFHDAFVILTNTLAFANIIKDSPDTIRLEVTRQGKKIEFRLVKADR